MTKNIWMDEARAMIHGQEQLVQLPKTPLKSELHEHYNAIAHKGALKCRHCDAKVHFNKGAQSVCGSNLKGASAHFHTNPGNTHADDCLWPLRMEEDHEGTPTTYDKDKGYRIHLNTGPSHPALTSSLYERDEERKLIVKDDDLRDREPFSIKGMDDLLTLVRKGEFHRLLDSRVIFRQFDIGWRDFFIRRDKTIGDRRYYKLLECLQDKGEQPVLFEFNLKARAQTDMFRRENKINGQPIFIKQDQYNRKHWIIPRARLQSEDANSSFFFETTGTYMLFAQACLNTSNTQNSVKHYIDMRIHSHKQIAKLSAGELAMQAKAHKPG
jgi:hypothetical protein